MFWPLSGELNVFLQIWQPQPALGASSFQIKYAGTEGWTCVIPQVGRVPLMLRMPNTDIFEIYCDPYSVEVEAIYF